MTEYVPKILPVLRSFVDVECDTVDHVIAKLGDTQLKARWTGVRDILGEAQKLESEIDVLSLEGERNVASDIADKERQAFQKLATTPEGTAFSKSASAYVDTRTRLSKTGDASMLAVLFVLAENQRRLLDMLGKLAGPSGGQTLESEIDVLSFAGAVVTNDEKLLGCLENVWGLAQAA